MISNDWLKAPLLAKQPVDFTAGVFGQPPELAVPRQSCSASHGARTRTDGSKWGR